jgi:hypothetical protein
MAMKLEDILASAVHQDYLPRGEIGIATTQVILCDTDGCVITIPVRWEDMDDEIRAGIIFSKLLAERKRVRLSSGLDR